MTGRGLLRGAAMLAALSLPFSASATTITIVNVDSAGVGFNDPAARTPVGGNAGTTLGAQRLNVFRHAAAFWEERIDSSVEILVRARFEALTCSMTGAVLGSAGPRVVWSDFTGAPLAKTWYSSALANKLAGEDLTPPESGETGEDILARFTTALDDGSCSFSRTWYYGLDGQPAAGTIDFATTVIHELAHGLGFLTFVDEETGARFAGDDGIALDDAFMVHLYDGTSGKTWDKMTDAERLTSATSLSNLLWNGPAVTAVASGAFTSGIGVGGRAQMYAPSPSEPGSSLSHWDTALYPNETMEPALTNGAQVIIADELMADIGWSGAGAAYSWILPSSAKSPGKGGAYYTTALSIGNRGSTEGRYRMKFLGNNADGTAGPESEEFVLGPNQSVTYQDVLGSVFSQGDRSYGAIRVTANVPTLNILGQSSTPVLTDWKSCVSTGSFGQSVPAFAAADLITKGAVRSIVGIRDDASFRTNLILANAGTSAVTVDATLLSTSGAVLGTKSWTLPPLGMTQGSDTLVKQMGISSAVPDAQLLLTTSTSGGSFAAYAAMIDNVTNDPRTLLPR